MTLKCFNCLTFSFKITLNGSSTFLNSVLFVWCLCGCVPALDLHSKGHDHFTQVKQ